MRLLLDTHVAVWSIVEPERIAPGVIALMVAPDALNFVSVVSLWEIAIKHSLARRGMGRMPISTATALREFDAAGFSILNVTAQHVLEVESPPPVRADPFDRLLLAQALSEPMRLVTHDATLGRHGDSVIHF